MVEVEPSAVHGGDRRSTAQKALKAITSPDQGAYGTLKKRGSNDADYLAARIKRDSSTLMMLSVHQGKSVPR